MSGGLFADLGQIELQQENVLNEQICLFFCRLEVMCMVIID